MNLVRRMKIGSAVAMATGLGAGMALAATASPPVSPDIVHAKSGASIGDRFVCRATFDPADVERGEKYVRLLAETSESLRRERNVLVPRESGLAVQALQPQPGNLTVVVLDTRLAEEGEWVVRLTDGERACDGAVRVVPSPEGDAAAPVAWFAWRDLPRGVEEV